jgi:hypothetical protein
LAVAHRGSCFQWKRRPPLCHPDRSVAEWRDLRFSVPLLEMFFDTPIRDPGTWTKRNLKPSSSLLSRLKDGKAIGVVDEDAPEESCSQDTIEPLCIGALLGGSAEEGHAGQFE